MNILAVYGTRPEYLKIKPLLEKSNNTIKSCHIQQHTNIINFGNPDYEILIEPKCNSRINNVFSEIFNKTERLSLEEMEQLILFSIQFIDLVSDRLDLKPSKPEV